MTSSTTNLAGLPPSISKPPPIPPSVVITKYSQSELFDHMMDVILGLVNVEKNSLKKMGLIRMMNMHNYSTYPNNVNNTFPENDAIIVMIHFIIIHLYVNNH